MIFNNAKSINKIAETGRAQPEGYSKNEYVFFQQLMGRDDLDAVIVAMPPRENPR